MEKGPTKVKRADKFYIIPYFLAFMLKRFLEGSG